MAAPASPRRVTGCARRALGLSSRHDPLGGAVASTPSTGLPRSAARTADEVTVTILSSNPASGATVGEWGLSVVTDEGPIVLLGCGHPTSIAM